jgi:periplasmic protein TonB
VVRSPVPTSIHLPSKLVEGNLIYKTIPQYPAIAKASHTEGTVVLQAMISKTGTIEGLHVISGSPMLQQAAIDAVRSWRYRPYMLNGQSVEVETTVNVIFKLQ